MRSLSAAISSFIVPNTFQFAQSRNWGNPNGYSCKKISSWDRVSSVLNEVGFYKEEGAQRAKPNVKKQLVTRCPLYAMPTCWQARLDHRIVFMLYGRKFRGHRKKTDEKDQSLRIKRTKPENDKIQNQAHRHCDCSAGDKLMPLRLCHGSPPICRPNPH